MNVWLHMASSITISAFIGGMTNYIAIKMLFHPRKQWLIGSWRIPFTPGLIPKRKQEIAHSLGHVVSTYLVTSEGLSAVMRESKFKDKMQRYAAQWVNQILTSEKTLRELALRLMTEEEMDVYKERLSGSLHQLVAAGMSWLWERYHQELVKDVIPGWTSERRERIVDQVVDYLLVTLRKELQSPAVDQWMRQTLRDLLGQSGGMFGMLAGLFVDETKILIRAKMTIDQKLQSAEVRMLLRNYINNVAQEWEEKRVYEVLAMIVDEMRKEETNDLEDESDEFGDGEKDEIIDDEGIGKDGISVDDASMDDTRMESRAILEWLLEQTRSWFSWNKWLEHWLEQPVNRLSTERFRQWVHSCIPGAVDRVLSLVAVNAERALTAIDLPRMVEEQVSKFPVERLEEVVLSVSGREFKAITWFGALLGGLIGLSQVILLRWFL